MPFTTMNYQTQDERAQRDEAEWHERMRREYPQSRADVSSLSDLRLEILKRRGEYLERLEASRPRPSRADVVKLPPFRKRESPTPLRDPPPAVPLRPAALRRTDLTASQLERLDSLRKTLSPEHFLRLLKLIDSHEDPEHVLATMLSRGSGEALLEKLHGFDLNRDHNLRRLVEALEGGEIRATELARLAKAAVTPPPLPSPFYRRRQS
jgi:hypothetical protein